MVNPLHFPPKAKRVIFLYQAGGPSHLETFDPKPKLAELDGKPMPESFTKGQQIAQLQGKKLICFGPQHKFKKFGKSGLEMCELFPELGSVADDLCIVRSMTTEQINHDPAHAVMNCGDDHRRPPQHGVVGVLRPRLRGGGSAGFHRVDFVRQGRPDAAHRLAPMVFRLPAEQIPRRQVQRHRRSRAVHQEPAGRRQRACRTLRFKAINALDKIEYGAVNDPEVLTRISQYEMAFKMQASVPGLMDMSKEPQSVLDMYGAKPGDGSFASNCLLARRLAERGVRFIQLYHRDWDHHGGIKANIAIKAQETDRAAAALIKDLKQRDMLKDTLVVFGGEFGRTPMSQGGDGRDHHIKGFSFVLAGGGIKGGTAFGATDDLGYAAVENPVTVHDFHATMLYLLGIDHKRLTVKYQGQDARLTFVFGDVVKGILA